jgi:hypothetical protein
MELSASTRHLCFLPLWRWAEWQCATAWASRCSSFTGRSRLRQPAHTIIIVDRLLNQSWRASFREDLKRNRKHSIWWLEFLVVRRTSSAATAAALHGLLQLHMYTTRMNCLLWLTRICFVLNASFRSLAFSISLDALTICINIMFLGSKVRRVRRADNLTAICEPIV